MWFLTFLSWIATSVYFVLIIISIRALVNRDERFLPVFALIVCIGLLAVLKLWLPVANVSKKPWILALASLPALLLLVGAYIRANPCVLSGC